MSDNIPLEIQQEIIKRFPVKLLIQFRSVSKTWKSLIDSTDFIIKHYNGHHAQVHHLLVKYESDQPDYENKYVSLIDDDTLHQQKLVSLTLPTVVKTLVWPRIVGCSDGLVCLYSPTSSDDYTKGGTVVLWNISIRKAIAIVLPKVIGRIYRSAIGFGVCRKTNDLKIVNITYADRHMTKGMETETCNPPEVEVFTLRTKVWRRSYGNLPRKSIHFNRHNEVVADGVFYWLAADRGLDYGMSYCNMIISFDMTSEEFREITFPDSLTDIVWSLTMYKLGESLVIMGQEDEFENSGLDVWMMGGGDSKSFTKLFTITSEIDSVAGFRRSGEPVIVISKGNGCNQLSIYEPNSKRIDNVGNIDGVGGGGGGVSAYPYMETLLLLDQPDLKVYNGVLKWDAKNKRPWIDATKV
ncbi:putative F-box protein At1g32420 [Bidens hawaiensis]|uniref:putative F-box protein At1g32420 n=1 Tax=Bidens hawaiensis TaxID=980011 RepID=UPI004049D928